MGWYMFKREILASLMFGLCQGLAFAAPHEQNKQPAVNPLANAMGQSGVVHCQGRVQQVADFLADSRSNSGAMLLLPPDHLNDHMVSAALEVFDGSVLFYSNMDFAPLVAYGCDAVFETVTYWPNSCEAVAKTQFKQAQNTGKMRQYITVLTAGDSLQIFLMPADKGCVAIKKQAVFDRF